MPERLQLIEAEAPVATLLAKPPVELYDTTADTGGGGEVIHERRWYASEIVRKLDDLKRESLVRSPT
jgi:hypothetical protein